LVDTLTKGAAVFVALCVLDFVWARYNVATTSKQPVKAGVYSVLIILLGAFSVISYTDDHRMLLPAAAGAFVGTYFAVLRD
jgi:hypothetical protein